MGVLGPQPVRVFDSEGNPVNSFGGTLAGNVTLNPSPNFIGLVTVANAIDATFGGNVTLNPSPNFIGLVTVANNISATFSGNTTLNPSPNFIGLVTSYPGSVQTVTWPSGATVAVSNLPNVTIGAALPAGSNAIGKLATNSGVDIGDVDILSIAAGDNNIGNVDIASALPAGANLIGLVTVANNISANLIGNTTLNPSPNWIGLVTAFPGSLQTVVWQSGATVAVGAPLPAGTNAIGKLAVNSGVDIGDVDILSIAAGDNNIGNVDIATIAAGDNNIGNVDIASIAAGDNNIGNVDIASALPAGANYIGLATVNIGTANNVTATLGGNVTLNPSPNFIGLVTVANTVTATPSWGSNITIHTAIISATGDATIFVAPASNRFFLKSLHVASLGRGEIQFKSGATTIIPFTALATTGGYIHDWPDVGYPGRAQADALVANLNGAATVSIGVSVYFAP